MAVVPMKEFVRTFNLPLRFSCLQRCGLCCSYKVHLSEDEVSRINRQSQGEFVKDSCLSKENGFCCFLDRDSRCTIYEQRPAHCRTFPFYVESGCEVDIDLSCPGIGRGESLNEDYFADFIKVNGAKSIVKNDALEDLFTLAGGFNFISRESFRQIGLDWCSSLNIKTGCWLADIFKSAQAQSQANACFDSLDETREFFMPGDIWNVHFDANKKLIRYHCRVEKDCLAINQKAYHFQTENRISLTKTQFDFIRQYMKLWFRRVLFYRFCTITSLQAPMINSPLNVAFVFITGLLEKIAQVQKVLAGYWAEQGEDVDDLEILKESIRLFDGRLRTKCRAATVQVCNNVL